MGNDNPHRRNPTITRRDFVGGVLMGPALAGAYAAAASSPTPSIPLESNFSSPGEPHPTAPKNPEPYPPLRSGLRGQYPGSFEAAHRLRDGQLSADAEAVDTQEHYDLVVVGAGISGLTAAYLYRQALGNHAKILVLDNHDDFGGHAKRNEFSFEGRTYLSFGGSMSIETPFPYSFTAKRLLSELGIDSTSSKRYERSEVFEGLGAGYFFDRDHFLDDKVVSGWGSKNWRKFFAEAPLSEAVRTDLTRLHENRKDYLPGLDAVQKANALKKMSYATFLTEHAGLLRESLPFFFGMGWQFRQNMQCDSCPAYTAWRGGAPGFSGMVIASEPQLASDEFHFPDGNASIARLLVNRLVPAAIGNNLDQESIVLAPVAYSNLDLVHIPTRIRLESTVIRVEHLGAPDRSTEKAVRVRYIQANALKQLTAANVILACFNQVIPFMVPSLPDDQRRALHYASKVPMQITNVLIRNWTSFQRLGVRSIHAPNGYHQEIQLDSPLAIGGYQSVASPSEPVIVQMVRNPHVPGLPRREQHRLARAEMLATPFEKIEAEVRSQLDRTLGPVGFDSTNHVVGLTVNRWPHGYAYSYDSLGDQDMPESERPHVIGRRAFGRISIANSDAGAGAFVNVAIDQAERAVQECLMSRGLS